MCPNAPQCNRGRRQAAGGSEASAHGGGRALSVPQAARSAKRKTVMRNQFNGQVGDALTFAGRRRKNNLNRMARLVGLCAVLPLIWFGYSENEPRAYAAAIWLGVPMKLLFEMRFPVSIDPIVEPKHLLSLRDAFRSRELWRQFWKGGWFVTACFILTGFIQHHVGWVPWSGAVGFGVFGVVIGFYQAKSAIELRRACA